MAPAATRPPPIYLDNAATTRALPEVIEAMTQLLESDYGNPSSRHAMGLAAEQHLRGARRTIATRLGVAAEQVIFTSGGTEANALALWGATRSHRGSRHVLVSAIEHPSVLRTAAQLEREGISVERIPVTAGGWVDPETVAARLRPETVLVAVMHVNNEMGVIQPIAQIAAVVKRYRPDCWLLVDAVQSFAELPLQLHALGADLLTLSAHKIHGPKGCGCLVRAPRVPLVSLWDGGGQEAGVRSGTENLPGIVGFARAAELCRPAPERWRSLAELLETCIRQRRPDAYAIGDQRRRATHILAIALPGVPTEILINLLEAKGVCASSGSACHSRQALRSHVLDALGVPRDHGVVRFSFGQTTTDEEVVQATEAIAAALDELPGKRHVT